MSILYEFIERVDNGESFHVDFQKRTIKVGKDYLVKNGNYDTEQRLGFGKMSLEHLLGTIEELYHNYKHSLPSERSDKKRKKYFKALTIEELDDFYLFNPIRREGAQARLEGFILCMILNGSFVWDEEQLGKWFWQSKKDPDLIILRDWIEK
jgi:hypothetical protein